MAKAKAEALASAPVEKIKWLDDVAEHDYDAAEAYGRADVADGFHRVSLMYRIDPYGEVPLKVA